MTSRMFAMFVVPLSSVMAASSYAYEFRVRFVERTVSESFPLIGNTIDASSLEPRRIRFEIGVFDDDAGPAPAGGVLGWNFGSLTVGGASDNSDEYRNSASGIHNGIGRLAPFTFTPAIRGANGVPASDPFDALTRIDATLGSQSVIWPCRPPGEPNPMPLPAIRGRNQYVSIHEITIDPREGATSYSVTYAGNLVAAREWRHINDWVPTDPCDPDFGGVLTYAPLIVPPRSISASFLVVVPSPTGAGVVVVSLVLCRRRRSAL